MMVRHGLRLTMALLTVCTLLAALPAEAAVKPRTIIVLPFDASALERDEQWIGEGASQVLGLALAQHPAFVQIERARIRTAAGRPELWGEAGMLLSRGRTGDGWTAALEATFGAAVIMIVGRTARQRLTALAAAVPLAALGFLAYYMVGIGGLR